MIARGVNVHIRNREGETLLFECFNWRSFPAEEKRDQMRKIVKLLIERGVDVNERNKSGQSVLHMSIKHANLENFQFILLDLSDIVQVCVRDNKGVTPFASALKQRRNQDMIDLMRIRLITDVYKKFKHTDSQMLRKQVLESVENLDAQSSPIDSDHLEAVKLIDVNDPNDTIVLFMKCTVIYSFFMSSEFKEKLTEDVLNILKSKKEFLKVNREKISQIGSDLQNSQAKTEQVSQLFESLCTNSPRELTSIKQVQQHGVRLNEEIGGILSKIYRTIRIISKHIKVASDFLQVLSQPKLKKLMTHETRRR